MFANWLWFGLASWIKIWENILLHVLHVFKWFGRLSASTTGKNLIKFAKLPLSTIFVAWSCKEDCLTDFALPSYVFVSLLMVVDSIGDDGLCQSPCVSSIGLHFSVNQRLVPQRIGRQLSSILVTWQIHHSRVFCCIAESRISWFVIKSLQFTFWMM